MAVRRVAVATTLGLGLVGGIAGIAAADGGASSHDSTVTTAPVNTVGGTVLGYVAGTSISVLTKGATAPTSYALDAATTMSGLAAGVTAPMVGDNVDLVLSSTTLVTVTSITIDAPHAAPPAMNIEGTVLAYVAGTSISVSTKDSTTPTLYALDASTTITGLGTGVTAPAVGDNVDLWLSTTTPVVVLTIKDEAAPQGDDNQQGNSGENQSGEHGKKGNHGFGQGMSDQGNQGFGHGNSDHGSSNNAGSGSSVGSFSNGGFNAGGSDHGSSHN